MVFGDARGFCFFFVNLDRPEVRDMVSCASTRFPLGSSSSDDQAAAQLAQTQVGRLQLEQKSTVLDRSLQAQLFFFFFLSAMM